MALIVQNTTFNRTFILIQIADHISPILGAHPTVLISKNGGAFVSPQGIVVEIGNGWYNLELTAIDTNTLGMLSYHITAINADPTDINDEVIASSIYIPPQPGTGPPIDTTPSYIGYLNWIYTIMGVSPIILDENNPAISLSLAMSMEFVNQYLNQASPLLYTQAVYNLGGAILCSIAQDTPPSTYWTDLRTQLGLNSFTPGLINSAEDERTAAALYVPDGLKNLTLADLLLLKTPWGRSYLAIAQSVGSMWGFTP
jgi:hypothetical protein